MKNVPINLPALILAIGGAVILCTSGADAATVAPDTHTRPRAVSFCTSEADDRGPCVYDPNWTGNGIGRPHVLHSNGTVRYLSPSLPTTPGQLLTVKGRIVRVHATGPHAGCVFLHYGEVTRKRASDDPRDGEWFCAR